MTPQEKQQFIAMEKNIAVIIEAQEEFRNVQADNGRKLDEVLTSLRGNDLGEIGLVARIKVLEDNFNKMQTKDAKTGVYVSIIKYLAGIIALLVIGYIFNQALNHNNNNSQPVIKNEVK